MAHARRRLRPAGILYVADSPRIGGGARSLMDLVAGLDRDRFAPLVVAPGSGALVDWARSEGVPHRVVRGGDLLGRIGLYRRGVQMALACGRLRPAIVHAMAPSCYRAAGFAGAILSAARICHLGSPPGAEELEWSFRFGPEAVIGCYEGQCRSLASILDRIRPRARAIDIRNGIDTETFTPLPPPAGAAWRFGAKHVVALVGTLSEVKGYPVFLSAAAAVAAGLEDCVFLALGAETPGSGYQAFLERRAEDLGIRSRLHFLGWRPEVPEILNAADVVVLPSLSEGLPLAVLEAMACARPVVATPVNGVPQAVLDGETGLLVPPSDPNALAAAILRLLGDRGLARRLGEAARRRVEREFSRERFVARIQTLYEELGARPTRA